MARVAARGLVPRQARHAGEDSQKLGHDLRLHRARRGEHPLDLTPTEWQLLEYFLRHAGQALTRQQILDAVWSYEADVLPTQVDVYVSYLRGKLRQVGRPDPIQTVRGIGYRFAASDV